MGYRVLLPQDIAAVGKTWLEARGYEVKIGRGIDSGSIAKDVVGCDAIIARSGQFTRDVMLAEPKLRVIARHGAGYDNIDVAAAKSLGIWVTFDPVSNGNAVAEQVIALLLACAKRLLPMDAATRRGAFQMRARVLNAELAGKTLGIAGLGRIGRMVARKAGMGLDMKIIAYDPFAKAADQVEMVDTLEELLARADFVSVNMPSTPETKGLFGKAQFRAMKPAAYFINAARGELVHEAALVEALKQGYIAGAGLDVYASEPPEAGHALFALENVILSPHNAALTEDAMQRMAMVAAKAVDAALSGNRPEWTLIEPDVSLDAVKR